MVRYYYNQPASTVEVAGKVYKFGDDVTECGPEFWGKYRCRAEPAQPKPSGEEE